MAELSTELADRYAAAGQVYSIADSVLVALAVSEPVLGTTDLYLPVVAPPLLTDQRTRRQLLAAFQRTHGVDRLVARTASSLQIVPGDALIHVAQFLSKQPEHQPCSGDLEIKPVDEASAELVRELLRRGLANGYANETVDPQRLADYVASAFEFGPHSPVSALVAWHGGEPIGHITWTDPVQDDVTGRSFIELVDVYVLEEFENRGLSRQLSRALERAVSGTGRRIRGNVLTADDGSHSPIAAALGAGGWRHEFHLWVAGPSPVS